MSKKWKRYLLILEKQELYHTKTGGFTKMSSEEEIREEARLKTVNELLDQQERERMRKENQSYKNR